MISEPAKNCLCHSNNFCTSTDFNNKINKLFEAVKEFELFLNEKNEEVQADSIRRKQLVDDLINSIINLLKIDYFSIEFKNSQVF